jgi:CRISPR-associated protein Cpf1
MNKESQKFNKFDDFTNLYSLSKTLRFELKPVGVDGKPLSEKEAASLLQSIREEDKKINEAYIALKPVLDKLHEIVITTSLSGLTYDSFNDSKDSNQNLLFNYFEEYKKGKERSLGNLEQSLRTKIGQTFEITANDLARSAGNDKKGKPIFKIEKDKERGINYLTDSAILKYIEKNIALFVDSPERVSEFIKETESIDTKGKKQVQRSGHLETFSSFFTYFSTFNENRENYYVYKEEKSTAVASRIIHENLPKFCDNLIQFSEEKEIKKKKSSEATVIPSRKDEYLNAHKFLTNTGRIKQIKDIKTNQMIEAYPIDEKMFEIQKFSECLTQEGIDEYNRVIGHYNQLINLYNQAKEKEADFRKLLPFKILFKQIGCGKRDALFLELRYETKAEQEKANDTSSQVLSVEGILELNRNAGNKFFQKQTDPDIPTIHRFIVWLKANENWEGVYWSKSAVDKISNSYLANWHEIKDRILKIFESKDKDPKENLKSVASYDKNGEEKIKIHDAVELSGLFEILDQDQDAEWSKRFFKASVLEDRKELINEELSPSKNLIHLLCADLENLAKEFLDKSNNITKIADDYKAENQKDVDKKGYKDESNILAIKEWLDTAKSILWVLKYFEVKQSKRKGNPIQSELSLLLDGLLPAKETDWFGWYDLVRNYLTKKPQDQAKENKLKLNFGNGSLLGGWSDGQEKVKGAVLLKNENRHFVGVLMKRSIFDTEDENNQIYDSKSSNQNVGRLILRNLAFKTLSGKGFVRDYKIKYSEITDKQEAILKLQELIRLNYIQKYPLLKEVTEKNYTDKKVFDADVMEILKECYECDFKAIHWDKVLEFVGEGSMYLFEIYSKDFSTTKGNKSINSKPNLQTIYWQHIFQENSSVQLCGGGEIFFREKAFNEKTIHIANQPIYRRRDEKTESLFNHDIIKDRRFTQDKYFFHIPIKINYMSSISGIRDGKPNPRAVSVVTDQVNTHFTQADDVQFLGIDRGEKHLLSYSLVNAKGEILAQDNFDVINKKDYLKEINEAAKLRRQKQENWQQKGNISNLKDGYISLVVHEIIEKMKDNSGNYKPTFIILEDLNVGFKRSRQKFEQQVYQKFELALAKKLNFLVYKKAKLGDPGSISKALQLTPPVSNFQDIENKKQLGIMFYTRANYTSVTDPATGWRKEIYLKTGTEKKIKDDILEAFTEIGVNSEGDYFFQYKGRNSEKTWTLWSGKNGKPLERYRARRDKDKNQYVVEPIDVKNLLDQLFSNFDKSKSLKEQLRPDVVLPKVNEHTAWETLRFIIDVIQQIRNSGDTNEKQEEKFFGADATKNQDDNFLLSPVRNEQDEHFDSRKYDTKESLEFPNDADANGAFNIARKGIIMYEHIKYWVSNGKQKVKKNKGEFPDLELFISDEEWDLWTTNREKWKLNLSSFASQKEKKTSL